MQLSEIKVGVLEIFLSSRGRAEEISKVLRRLWSFVWQTKILRSYRRLFQYEDTNTNESGTTRPSMATRTGIHSTRPQASSPRPLTPLLKPHTSLWVVSPCEVGHRALPGIQRKDQPLA